MPYYEFGGPEAARKKRLRFEMLLDKVQEEPRDPRRALEFIHAAFEVGQGDSDVVKSLLLDTNLVKSASSLLSESDERVIYLEPRCTTITCWADFLRKAGRPTDGLDMLEAAFAVFKSPSLREQLKSAHYAIAQYPDPNTASRVSPEERIRHLKRILELGYNLGYIHKFLAEAYHDLGDDDQARACLQEAFRVDPAVSGTVRISRALGISADNGAPPRRAAVKTGRQWTRPTEIPAPAQIRGWAAQGEWQQILTFAAASDYSASLLPRARDTLRTIATVLGTSQHPGTQDALVALSRFTHYWDVMRAAWASLAKVGDHDAVGVLKEILPHVSGAGSKECLKHCISYLAARLGGVGLELTETPDRMLVEARKAADKRDFGRTRLLLELALAKLDGQRPGLVGATGLLARSCYEMGDIVAAIETIKPVSNRLCFDKDQYLIGEVRRWLWSTSIGDYDNSLDATYQWALEIDAYLISSAMMGEEMVSPLREASRWLEILGDGAGARTLRAVIRMVIPGPHSVDSDARDRYVRQVTLSDGMQHFLRGYVARVKAAAIAKSGSGLRVADDDGPIGLDDDIEAADEPVTVEAAQPPVHRFPIPPPPAPPAKHTVTIDMAKVHIIRQETREVMEVLAPIYEDERMAWAPAQEPAPMPGSAPGAPGSRFPGLESSHASFIDALRGREQWERAEFEALARGLGLLPDGALETINEWAFDVHGGEFIEDGETMTIHWALLPETPGDAG